VPIRTNGKINGRLNIFCVTNGRAIWVKVSGKAYFLPANPVEYQNKLIQSKFSHFLILL